MSESADALLDTLRAFCLAPTGPVPIDLSGTILDDKQGEYCAIILNYDDRKKLHSAIVEYNKTQNQSDLWIQYAPEIVDIAITLGVTNAEGIKLFGSPEAAKLVPQLHPKISKIFWRDVLSLNGFFTETNKDLVKNLSGTGNLNGSSISVPSSDVQEKNSQTGSDEKSTAESSNSGVPTTA